MKCVFCGEQTPNYVETETKNFKAEISLCWFCLEKVLFFQKVDFDYNKIKSILKIRNSKPN